MRKTVLTLLAALLSAAAFADEQPIDLKKAPGLDLVEGNCAAAIASTTCR